MKMIAKKEVVSSILEIYEDGLETVDGDNVTIACIGDYKTMNKFSALLCLLNDNIGIVEANFGEDYFSYYEMTYVLLLDGFGIWIEPIVYEDKNGKKSFAEIYADVAFIDADCNSKILQYIQSENFKEPCVFMYSKDTCEDTCEDEYEDDDNDCNGDCESCYLYDGNELNDDCDDLNSVKCSGHDWCRNAEDIMNTDDTVDTDDITGFSLSKTVDDESITVSYYSSDKDMVERMNNKLASMLSDKKIKENIFSL